MRAKDIKTAVAKSNESTRKIADLAIASAMILTQHLRHLAKHAGGLGQDDLRAIQHELDESRIAKTALFREVRAAALKAGKFQIPMTEFLERSKAEAKARAFRMPEPEADEPDELPIGEGCWPEPPPKPEPDWASRDEKPEEPPFVV